MVSMNTSIRLPASAIRSHYRLLTPAMYDIIWQGYGKQFANRTSPQ